MIIQFPHLLLDLRKSDNRESLNFQYKALNVMGEILAYFKKILRNFFECLIRSVTIKTWISSDSPTQEEFENLCFVAVDLRIRQLWVFVYGTSKRSFAIDFSSLISPLFAVKKGDTQKNLPSI